MSSNKSKSSSSTTNNNATGQITNAGDNLGVNVAGVNGNVSVKMTDHGAINKTFDFLEESMDSLGSTFKAASDKVFNFGSDTIESNQRVSSDAIKSNERVSSDAIKSNEKVLGDSFKFSSDTIEESLSLVGDTMSNAGELVGDMAGKAMEETRKANEAALKAAGEAQKEAFNFSDKIAGQAFDFGNDALKANQDAVRDSLKFGNEALLANRETLEESFDFGNKALDGNNKVTDKALTQMRENASDTVELAKDIANQSATTTKEVIALSEKMNDSTEKAVSQSQTGSSDSMAKVAMVTALAFGIAAAVRG